MKGAAVLRNPLSNRGSAFSLSDRKALGLEALLPASVQTQAQQVARAYRVIQAHQTRLGKYRELMSLQDRNEYLFYRVLTEHLSEFLPIVYTPTVGEAAQQYSSVFQRGRGIWITPEHRGRIAEVLSTAVGDRDIRLMVVTDNEAILGLGDQGAGGMTISIGKLSLYTACAGIAPEHTLPVSLDVGTDNTDLRNDPDYLGLNQERLRGPDYDALLEEFVSAAQALFPQVMIQWEDFRKDNALSILDRYKHRVPSFNDDIQGTGAVTLAGVFSALRILNSSLEQQRFLIYGAGAAGLGIARQIKAALSEAGVSAEDMDGHIGLLDSQGLLVDDQAIADDYKHELAWQSSSAQALGLTTKEDRQLAGVVDAFKPTVLIGSSGQPGSFSQAVIESMYAACQRPVIMPLSNPTSAAEAVPADLLSWTDGQAIIATGSPFEPVEMAGVTHRFGQGNNVFIFPGLGQATMLGQVREVSDSMITAAAKSLADSMLDEELAAGLLYPDVSRLKETTMQVTCGVLTAAMAEDAADLQAGVDLEQLVDTATWSPSY